MTGIRITAEQGQDGRVGLPASYDTYVMETFKGPAADKSERRAFSDAVTASLRLLADFHDQHAGTIRELVEQHPTITFSGAQGQPMTQAKVIDIFGFQRAWSGAA